MKINFLTYLMIFLFVNVYAQETIVNIEHQFTLNPFEVEPEDVYYFKDTNDLLDKYVGTWVYDNGTHYLKIVITKHEHVPRGSEGYNDNDFDDLIYIKFQYKLNGTEKYNTDGGIRGNKIINVSTVKLIYYEPSLTSCYRRKSANLKLAHGTNSSGVEQLTWARTNSITEGWSECPDGTAIDNSDFLIPANLVLTKQ